MAASIHTTARLINRAVLDYDAEVAMGTETRNGAPEDLQSIWLRPDAEAVCILDQRHLPFRLVIEELASVQAVCEAIRGMHLRGAPLIGVAAGYGMYLACREALGMSSARGAASVAEAARELASARPTAVNLAWAVRRQLETIERPADPEERVQAALAVARSIEAEDIECCRRIGEHGRVLIERMYARKREQVNVLTHCNAGWLACVRYGTATAPIYATHRAGLPVHVWVDETRPRNQGARLTAWELAQAGVAHTVVVDNTGGHLMQHGRVDLVIVGSDRTTRRGDVANKIGTYLKALAACDNGVPFYAALPSSTIDWALADGLAEIPIEERDPREVRTVEGWLADSQVEVLVSSPASPAVNFAFDVTPARLVTGLITERGICPASEQGLRSLFPDKGEA
jgi:methylthioribose-1-phosphate isomerase